MSRNLIVIALALVVVVWRGSAPLQTAPAASHALTPQNTRERWAIDLLAALGNDAPTPETVIFVVEWTLAEDSGDGAMKRNNPLNTTICGHNWVGAINGDGACGVGGYATEQDGIAATIDTITQANFSAIAFALQANNPYGAKLALWAAPWAESHYGYGANWPHYERHEEAGDGLNVAGGGKESIRPAASQYTRKRAP